MADDAEEQEQCYVCERRVPTRDVYCLLVLDREGCASKTTANTYCAKCFRTHRTCAACAELIDTDEGYCMTAPGKRLTCTRCARPCSLCGYVYFFYLNPHTSTCAECEYLALRSPTLASPSASASSSSDTLILSLPATAPEEAEEPK